MKKKISFFILYLAMGMVQVFAQTYEQTAEFSCDEFSLNLLKTSDELYIGDNGDKYLMNKSPLSFFKGYKSIFSNHSQETIETIEDNVEICIIPYPAFRYGSVGKSEKDYTAYWILLKEQLYLCKIDFPDSIKNEQTIYPDMEKFTGVHFLHFSKMYAPSNVSFMELYGPMPAIWFTDTLYVKKAVTKEDPYLPPDSWKVKPYLQMVFNKGKLTSKKIIDNKMHTRKITRTRGRAW